MVRKPICFVWYLYRSKLTRRLVQGVLRLWCPDRRSHLYLSRWISIKPLIGFRAAQVRVSTGHRYSTQLISDSNSVVIGSGSTRGLVVHPFGMSLFSHRSRSFRTLMRFALHCSHGGDPYCPPIFPFITCHNSPTRVFHSFYRGSSNPHRIFDWHRVVHHSAR